MIIRVPFEGGPIVVVLAGRVVVAVTVVETVESVDCTSDVVAEVDASLVISTSLGN
jgi:hypothetical protein